MNKIINLYKLFNKNLKKLILIYQKLNKIKNRFKKNISKLYNNFNKINLYNSIYFIY